MPWAAGQENGTSSTLTPIECLLCRMLYDRAIMAAEHYRDRLKRRRHALGLFRRVETAIDEGSCGEPCDDITELEVARLRRIMRQGDRKARRSGLSPHLIP